MDRAHEHDKQIAAERSALASALALHRTEQAAADAHRTAQTSRFRTLGGARLFAIALGDAAPDGHDAAEQWSARRAVEVARGLPAGELATRAKVEALSAGLSRRVH